MKVFTVGDCDWVCAENVDDAWDVYAEHNGGKRADYDDDDCGMEEVPDNAPLKIWCNAGGTPDEPHGDNKLIERTAAEWAAQEGRGFLCSTEI
jgi:hypothetical protein